MPKRCGDETSFKYKVTSELIDKYVTLLICRKKKFDIAGSFTEKITKEETKKIKWPDQEVEGKKNVFYGGRKVDYKGLNKLSYKDKFGHQEFEIDLYQGANKKKSAKASLKIESYPDAGPHHQQVGIPMPTEIWKVKKTVNPHTGHETWSPDGINSNFGKKYWKTGKNCGNFHIRFKDGVVIITVKIKATVSGGGKTLTKKVFKDIKKKSESFWNSHAEGLLQWVYHRNKCMRGDKCNCSIVRSKSGKFTSAGCCKAPVQVKIEEGDDNPVNITVLTPTQLSTPAYMATLRANTMNFYYPENRAHTFAHEVGHMMGFPDQYWYGVIETGALDANGIPKAGASFPVDDSSIMGQNMTKAKNAHISAKWFKSWINSNVDAMNPLSR